MEKKTKKKKVSPLYKVVAWLVWFFYPKIKTLGAENLPDEPVLIIGNHTQMNGPIACEFHLPVERYTWCAAQMMKFKEVPGYAFEDFWSQKPGYTHWFYRILSYLITPLAVLLFNNANTIPVYHDARVLSTFRTTMEKLEEGASVVIFPEQDIKYNHILYDFQRGFVDIARMYYRKTGKQVCFVPLYIAPALKKMYLGKPIRYCAANPAEEERERICRCLMEEITRMACALPRHRVVPYRNIPKKDYPYNIPAKENQK